MHNITLQHLVFCRNLIYWPLQLSLQRHWTLQETCLALWHYPPSVPGGNPGDCDVSSTSNFAPNFALVISSPPHTDIHTYPPLRLVRLAYSTLLNIIWIKLNIWFFNFILTSIHQHLSIFVDIYLLHYIHFHIANPDLLVLQIVPIF